MLPYIHHCPLHSLSTNTLYAYHTHTYEVYNCVVLVHFYLLGWQFWLNQSTMSTIAGGCHSMVYHSYFKLHTWILCMYVYFSYKSDWWIPWKMKLILWSDEENSVGKIIKSILLQPPFDLNIRLLIAAACSTNGNPGLLLDYLGWLIDLAWPPHSIFCRHVLLLVRVCLLFTGHRRLSLGVFITSHCCAILCAIFFTHIYLFQVCLILNVCVDICIYWCSTL